MRSIYGQNIPIMYSIELDSYKLLTTALGPQSQKLLYLTFETRKSKRVTYCETGIWQAKENLYQSKPKRDGESSEGFGDSIG